MHYGEKSDDVRKLQSLLIEEGYQLPRFGADGKFGQEVLTALNHWFSEVNGGEYLVGEGESEQVSKQFMLWKAGKELRHDHPQLHRYEGADKGNIKRVRGWGEIDRIVLHQTGCKFGRYEGWAKVPIHIAIPSHGKFLGSFMKLHPLSAYLYHANNWNRVSVGIEIEGNFCGIEGDRSTHWATGGGPDTLSEVQMITAREACRWICETVNNSGGEIKKIVAHRQVSNQRRADPGSLIWREVGVWAMKTLSLSDGGLGYKEATGFALPDVWTGEDRGVEY